MLTADVGQVMNQQAVDAPRDRVHGLLKLAHGAVEVR
jgi:hypothetical protein